MTEATLAPSGDELRSLAAAWVSSNARTPSDPAWREPAEIAAEALAVDGWDSREPGADRRLGAFLLVLRGIRALDAGDAALAARHLRGALALEQNNLHAQGLLARAEGRETPPPGRELFCEAPFRNLETAPGGEAYVCCPAWLPKPIGNLDASSAEEVWNSPAARDLRASIHDGSFRHCSRVHCPKLSGGNPVGRSGQRLTPRDRLDPELRAIVGARRVRLDRGPRRVILSHDRSCNLACPSCRSGLILARKAEQARLDAMAERTILPLLAGADRLRVTSSGDPFGSAHFQHVLRRLEPRSGPRLELQTNGLLLTERLWDDLRLEGRVAALIVSIDAATAATYEVVRRPGRWAVLVLRLAAFARLRAEGRIDRLRFDFVVQARNWREVPAFLDLARSHGADAVKLQMIRSWLTWSPEGFAAQDVGDPAHPDHAEAMALLAHATRDGYAQLWGAAPARAA